MVSTDKCGLLTVRRPSGVTEGEAWDQVVFSQGIDETWRPVIEGREIRVSGIDAKHAQPRFKYSKSANCHVVQHQAILPGEAKGYGLVAILRISKVTEILLSGKLIYANAFP